MNDFLLKTLFCLIAVGILASILASSLVPLIPVVIVAIVIYHVCKGLGT